MILIMAVRSSRGTPGRRECRRWPTTTGPTAHAGPRPRRRPAPHRRPQRGPALGRASALTVMFVVVEAVTAFVAGSLALLSDAAHMLTDGVAIALALGAIVVANRASHEGCRTFGLFRLEILAVAAERDPDCSRSRATCWSRRCCVSSTATQRRGRARCSWSRSRACAVNLVVFFMLRAGAQDSLAVRGAYVDAIADAAGSVGVIVAAVVIATTGLGSRSTPSSPR